MRRSPYSGIRPCAGGLLALVALALAAPAALAKPIIVGSPLEGKFSHGKVSTEGTYFNSSLSEPGAHVVSPVDGAIIEVNLVGNNEGPYRVRVLSPDGGSSYTAKASSPWLTLAPGGESHFHTLKIEAGDTVGLDMPAGAELSGLVNAGPKAAYAFWAPPLEEDASLPYTGTQTEVEMGFNAIVLPEPTVSRVAPKSLPARKGGKVKIYGRDFQRVLKVNFGRLRISRYRVVSERLIVAFVPKLAARLKTRVRVTTAAGTSAPKPAARFEFSD
jgi:hypothetical protein